MQYVTLKKVHFHVKFMVPPKWIILCPDMIPVNNIFNISALSPISNVEQFMHDMWIQKHVFKEGTMKTNLTTCQAFVHACTVYCVT